MGCHRLSSHGGVVRFRGIRVSSPEQTFIEPACMLPLVDRVVLGDSLVRNTTADKHAKSDDQWGRDIDRREDLDGDGWLIVVRSNGIHVEPLRTPKRIADAMRARGAKSVPTRFRDEWHSRFPGRSV
jgi:hypothetical protein